MSQLKTVFHEAMAPCNKNLALLQKKVDEELAKTVTQVTELMEQAKTSFASAAEGEFKKVIEHIDWKVMSKLQGMANASSERFGRVESQQSRTDGPYQEPYWTAFQLRDYLSRIWGRPKDQPSGSAGPG